MHCLVVYAAQDWVSEPESLLECWRQQRSNTANWLQIQCSACGHGHSRVESCVFAEKVCSQTVLTSTKNDMPGAKEMTGIYLLKLLPGVASLRGRWQTIGPLQCERVFCVTCNSQCETSRKGAKIMHLYHIVSGLFCSRGCNVAKACRCSQNSGKFGFDVRWHILQCMLSCC